MANLISHTHIPISMVARSLIHKLESGVLNSNIGMWFNLSAPSSKCVGEDQFAKINLMNLCLSCIHEQLDFILDETKGFRHPKLCLLYMK